LSYSEPSIVLPTHIAFLLTDWFLGYLTTLF
jgi:hypothetical protein